MNGERLWTMLFPLLMILLPLIYVRNKRKKRDRIEKLGKEVYEKLKNDWDARRTDARKIMGELNYIIDELNEYREQNEYVRKSYYEADYEAKKNSINDDPFILVVGPVKSLLSVKMNKKLKEAEKLSELTKKTLDDYIKKEWNPRIRILKENAMDYYPDKELRDAFTQFNDADKEIQKLTIEGEYDQAFKKTLKVAGIVLVATTGLALGAMRAANRAVDRQSLRDNLGI